MDDWKDFVARLVFEGQSLFVALVRQKPEEHRLSGVRVNSTRRWWQHGSGCILKDGNAKILLLSLNSPFARLPARTARRPRGVTQTGYRGH